MGNPTRNMALRIIGVFFIGTLIGSMLPESGNVLVNIINNYEMQKLSDPHVFNPCFLFIGIVGTVLALCPGRGSGSDES